jgi:hypothetical protein
MAKLLQAGWPRVTVFLLLINRSLAGRKRAQPRQEAAPQPGAARFLWR